MTPAPSEIGRAQEPGVPHGDRAASFGDVVRAWHERGEPVPVAVVVSVFDDCLGASVDPRGRERADLEDVLVLDSGAASLREAVALRAVTPLLMEALGADLPGDHAVPPGAWGLLDRLTSDDPKDRPADAEQLRDWLRNALGAPAAHEEVRDFVYGAAAALADADEDDVHELETLLPSPSDGPLPIPSPAAEAHVVTLPPERDHPERAITTDVVRKREDEGRDDVADTDLDSTPHLPTPLPDSLQPDAVASEATASPTIIDPPGPPHLEAEDGRTAMPEPLPSEASPSSDPARPVVRHDSARQVRPVSVVSAPAARRSARASVHGSDSLIVPADERKNWIWVVAVGIVAAVVYALFFR